MESFSFKILFQILLCGLSFGLDLDHDLRKLTHMIPGMYRGNKASGGTSQRQSDVAPLTSVMNAVYMPVEVKFLPNAFNVYVEQTLQRKESPHRQWLYSFAVDEKSRAIRLKVYNFVKDALKEKVRKNPSSLMYLMSNDVYTRPECDMFWRRLGQLFVASTSKQCVADVNDKKVRISVMTTLTPTSLQIDEGWYDVKDGTKIIELEGPVLLNKISSHPGDRYLEGFHSDLETVGKDQPQATAPSSLQKDGAIRRHAVHQKYQQIKPQQQLYSKHLDSYSNKLSQYKKQLYNKNAKKSYISKTNNGMQYKNTDPKPKPKHSGKRYSKRSWTLRTYRAVVDALVTGHVVYYTARMKRCKHRGTVRDRRVTIGDYVDVYEIGNDYNLKEPHSYISFSSSKVVHSDLGFFSVVRQVTVYRNGSVAIETVQNDEAEESERYSVSECQLFSDEATNGEVKFFLDPQKDVNTVKRFGQLRSALYKGKRLRTTMDISKCSGGKVQHVTVGAEIRNFESVNNGRDIGFTVKQSRVSTPRNHKELVTRSNSYTLVTVRKHGQAEVLVHTKHVNNFSRNHSVISGFVKYLCDTDSNSSTQAVSFYNV